VDLAVATASRHKHVREWQGRRWSHTIDPRTGEPVANPLVSVTVLHPQCQHADALATTLMVLGPEDGFAFAQRRKLAALFVEHDGAQYLGHRSRRWTELVHHDPA
jgi:thiamine biosynthesis lipoprotein